MWPGDRPRAPSRSTCSSPKGKTPAPETPKRVSEALLKIAHEDSVLEDARKLRDTTPEVERAVRRDESVIAEAVRLRQSAPARAWAQLVAIGARVAGAFRWLGTLPAQLDALPRGHRRLVIAAPFTLAALLGLGLFRAGEPGLGERSG